MTIATNPETGEVMRLSEQGAWEKTQTAINPDTKEMLAYDGKDWKPVPASKGVFNYIDDAVRSIASGVTFGWMDEIAAKADEATGRGGSYEENLKKEMSRDANIPLTIKIPGEIAGAIGTTILTLPLAAWRGLAAVASKLPEAARFGALGAAEGALAGAGTADPGQRLQGAATGAAVGAPIGAVAPSVVRGVESTISAARNAMAPRTGAAADIGRAVVRDEMTPAMVADDFIAATAERPGVATVADVGGENVRGLVERIAQTPGAGRTQVIPALTERQQKQATRITEDLRSLTGTTQTAKRAIDDTIAERSAAAKPLYDEAIAFDLSSSPEAVKAFLGAISTGWGKAIIESPAFKRTLQTEYGIQGQPSPSVLMAVVDAWKQTADDLIGKAINKEGSKNQARVIAKMRDDVLEVVDKVNPAYASARNVWAGPSKYLDAIEEGRGILSPKMDAESFTARFKSLSASEQEAQRIGAISAIVSKIGNDGAKLADITKYLRSPEMRAKIASIMPDDEAAAAWAKRLEFEVKSSELTARALGNSATARRLAEREDANGIVGDLVMDALSHGPTSMSFLKSVFTAGPRWLRDTLRSRTDKELADMLVNPDRAADLPAILKRAAKAQGTASSRPGVAAGVTAGSVAASE